MNNFYDMVISSYGGACLFIILGILGIRNTNRNPQKDPFSVDQTDFYGYLSGYGLVALGIMIIVLKMLGKW
jgi:hypothetical protein